MPIWGWDTRPGHCLEGKPNYLEGLKMTERERAIDLAKRIVFGARDMRTAPTAFQLELAKALLAEVELSETYKHEFKMLQAGSQRQRDLLRWAADQLIEDAFENWDEVVYEIKKELK